MNLDGSAKASNLSYTDMRTLDLSPFERDKWLIR